MADLNVEQSREVSWLQAVGKGGIGAQTLTMTKGLFPAFKLCDLG